MVVCLENVVVASSRSLLVVVRLVVELDGVEEVSGSFAVTLLDLSLLFEISVVILVERRVVVGRLVVVDVDVVVDVFIDVIVDVDVFIDLDVDVALLVVTGFIALAVVVVTI